VRTSAATNPAALLKPPTAELATTAGAWRLVVSFHWCEDRFEHRVLVIPDPAERDADILPDVVPLSEIGDAPHDGPHWPRNPPLQQLDECLLTGQRRGLVGLGMAGTSHWSLAVEAGKHELWFDVACRVQEPPGRLQSCYRLTNSLRWADSQTPACDGRPVVRVSSTGQLRELCSLQVDEASTEMTIAADLREVQLRPRYFPDRCPGTVRWRYGWIATA
jgi:hypothetical protein